MKAPEKKSSPGFETSDMSAGTVARVLGVFAVIVVVAVAGIGFGVGWMERQDSSYDVSLTRQQTLPLQFSGPALQAHPHADLRGVLEREDRLLLDYAWIDDAHTRARVPIGRAIALVVGRSLDGKARGAVAVSRLLALWPVSASLSAGETDHIILAFTVVTLLLTVPIFLSITYYALRYRAGREADRTTSENRSVLIEMSWMLVPFVLTLIFFAWAVRLFDEHRHPPAGAMVVNAIGRQWMWKFQHEGGQAEINDLHLPIGQNVLIRMISQDVIHGLYIPALRIQMETLPGRYTEMWFKGETIGQYHVLCSEYCGTDHSVMGGTLTLMEPAAYQDWLAHSETNRTLAQQGRALFASYGCAGCHLGASTVRAPSLAGLYGRQVTMRDGTIRVADEGFLREKIVTPDLHPIAGYAQRMPAYQGAMAEDDLLRVIATIKAEGSTR